MPRPTAVTVFGVCNIVLGALALLCLPISLVGAVVQQANPDLAVPPGVLFGRTVATVIQLVLELMLLISGIGLLRLRPAGRRLAIITGLSLAVLTAIGMIVLLVQTLVTQQPPGAVGTDQDAVTRAAMVAGLVIGALIGAAIIAYYGAMAYILSRPEIAAAFEAPAAPDLPMV